MYLDTWGAMSRGTDYDLAYSAIWELPFHVPYSFPFDAPLFPRQATYDPV